MDPCLRRGDRLERRRDRVERRDAELKAPACQLRAGVPGVRELRAEMTTSVVIPARARSIPACAVILYSSSLRRQGSIFAQLP